MTYSVDHDAATTTSSSAEIMELRVEQGVPREQPSYVVRHDFRDIVGSMSNRSVRGFSIEVVEDPDFDEPMTDAHLRAIGLRLLDGSTDEAEVDPTPGVPEGWEPA